MSAILIAAICLVSLAPEMSAQTGRGRSRAGAPGPPLMERLHRMSPTERDRMLSNLSPEKREKVEQSLEKYANMPPAAKERLDEEYKNFQQLTPEKQERVRELFQEFNEIPEERRKEVRRELTRLRNLNSERRNSRTNSESFRNKFDESEQRLLEELSDLLGK